MSDKFLQTEIGSAGTRCAVTTRMAHTEEGHKFIRVEEYTRHRRRRQVRVQPRYV